jgi:hypothetical protein
MFDQIAGHLGFLSGMAGATGPVIYREDCDRKPLAPRFATACIWL